jgi:hypothetical protein
MEVLVIGSIELLDDVRYGSKADMAIIRRDVCFVPEADSCSAAKGTVLKLRWDG